MQFIVGIIGNLISNILSGTSIFLFKDLSENVQWKTWKAENFQLSKSDSDFVDHYAQTIVELKKKGRSKPLIQFYGEKHVIETIRRFWYAQVQELEFYENFRSLTERFTLSQQIEGFSADEEVATFLKLFGEILNMNRTASDTEIHQNITKILSWLNKHEFEAPVKYLTNVPSIEVSEFLGREDDLGKLQALLKDKEQATVLVKGIGGIGKTTLLTAFANKMSPQYNFQIWLSQTVDFKSALVSESRLIRNLRVDLNTDNLEEKVRLILNKISNLKGKCLFVIDNASNDIMPYKSILPRNTHTIISSREDLNFNYKIFLDLLDEEIAINLFKRHYCWDSSTETARKIVEILDFHTLTIELVAKTAQVLRITPAERLLKRLEHEGLSFARKAQVSTRHSQDKEIDNVFDYLCSIFDFSQHNETELFLLEQFSVLLSSFIEFTDLQEILLFFDKDDDEKEELIQAITNLHKKGWLIHDRINDSYKMHLIIQQVVMKKLCPNFTAVESTIYGIYTKLYIDQTKNEDPLKKTQWIPYAQRLIELFGEEKEIGVAELYNCLGEIQKFIGQHVDALKSFEFAISLGIKLKGKKDEKVAMYKSNLGLVYSDLGNHRKAYSYVEEALDIDLSIFDDPDHINVITRKSNLAILSSLLGNYDKAEKLIREVLNSDLRKYGENHAFIAKDRANLAGILRRQKRLDEAKTQIEKAIDFDVKNAQEGRLEAYHRKSILSHILLDQRNYKQAETIRLSILDFNFENFGQWHSDVAADYRFLSEVNSRMLKDEVATTYIDKSIEIFNQVLGVDNPKTQEAKAFKSSLHNRRD